MKNLLGLILYGSPEPGERDFHDKHRIIIAEVARLFPGDDARRGGRDGSGSGHILMSAGAP
ncbi:MAG TPA: hypothetical protein VL242_35445 [Sorangium sp.]|nr:hypothetical protein [Sorangium sp.]